MEYSRVTYNTQVTYLHIVQSSVLPVDAKKSKFTGRLSHFVHKSGSNKSSSRFVNDLRWKKSIRFYSIRSSFFSFLTSHLADMDRVPKDSDELMISRVDPLWYKRFSIISTNLITWNEFNDGGVQGGRGVVEDI